MVLFSGQFRKYFSVKPVQRIGIIPLIVQGPPDHSIQNNLTEGAMHKIDFLNHFLMTGEPASVIKHTQ